MIIKRIISIFCLCMGLSLAFAQNAPTPQLQALKAKLSKLEIFSENDFLKSLPAELNGYKLESPSYYSGEGTSAATGTANYKNGDKNIFITITDGATVAGSEEVISTAQNYLDLMEIDNGDLMKVVDFKGTKAVFDASFYESDGMSSIQYFDSKRFAIIASANKVPLEELQKFLEAFPY